MSAGIELGVAVSARLSGAPPGRLFEWASRIDDGPFSTLAIGDRVVYDAPEPLAVLAAVTGVTRRVRLLTSVLVAPTRETTLLARQAATIDALSGGRLSLGIGIGIREDDYAATGFPFRSRGRRLDEQLPVLRRLWSAEPAGVGVGPIGPRPARRGGPEVLIGGYVDAVARRIATWGDGFMVPGGGEPAQMAELWDRILGAWSAAARPGRPRRVSSTYFALGPSAEDDARAHIDAWYGFDPVLAERRLRGIPTTAEAVTAAIRRQADTGADEVILRAVSVDLATLDRLEELVARL